MAVSQTLRQIVTRFYARQGVGIAPTVVAGSTDVTAQQIVELLNEGLRELQKAVEGSIWPELEQRATFLHENAANYGALNLVNGSAVPDFGYLIQDCLMDVQTRLQVAGPFSELEWTEMLTMGIVQATYNFRIFDGYLRIYPVPSDPLTYQFVLTYSSAYTVRDSSGQAKLDFTADDDVPRIPWEIMLADLRWRYKKEKGMAFEPEKLQCDAMIAAHFNNRGNSKTLNAATPGPGDWRWVGPALLISPGGTSVP